MTNLKPLHGRIILKLETASVRVTRSGIVYDDAFRKREYAYGHVYQINEENSKLYGLKVGQRVIFDKDRIDTVTYKSKKTSGYIDIVLVFIHPDDILAMVSEERTVLDYLEK